MAIEFSEQIKDFLAKNYPDKDIEKMSLEELKLFKEEIIHKRQEYALLENGMKILANAAYGACASQYFPFFNVALAGDITGECRELTKTMWKNLEDFFHETIWERKDLWEKFNFELDENKHDWFRKQTVTCYSDTDSVSSNSVLKIKDKSLFREMHIEDLFNILGKGGYDFKNANGSEFVYNTKDFKILNYVNGELKYVPVKWVMKHNVKKDKWKLKTKSGKEIIVTGDHSLIVIRDGKKIAIKVKDINKETDKILTIKTA